MPDGSIENDILQDSSAPHQPETTFQSSTADDSTVGVRESGEARRNGPPAVNIRVTVPILKSRFYFSLMSGRERRNPERLAVERRSNPLKTRPNILFVIIGALALYMLTLGLFLVYAAVLEV